MNREYEYNRDKGRCKICGNNIAPYFRHCHRIKPGLAIDKINKVPNLAWLCYDCLKVVKGGTVPESIESRMNRKVPVRFGAGKSWRLLQRLTYGCVGLLGYSLKVIL